MDALSLRCYFVEFYGQAAHAVAAPWEGRSALAAARKFLDLIDARRECFTPVSYTHLSPLDPKKKKLVKIGLEDFPKRPDRTTKIELSLGLSLIHI